MHFPDAIEHLPIDRLIPYARNARTHSEEQVAQIAGSMREFGWTNPVLIDGEDGIIAGHGRVLAARKLALDTIPCIRLRDITPTQRKALVIADNKLALNAGWDIDLLALELSDLRAADIDLELMGYSDAEFEELIMTRDGGSPADDGREAYTHKIAPPIYEPKGDPPEPRALYDDTKTRKLLLDIDAAADLPEDVADFLRHAAARHTSFDFAGIAEYYAHAPAPTQALMEASALVIIDFGKAIEGGFVRLTQRLFEQYAQDLELAGDDDAP